ncbi:hypothetical protein AXF42_Ash014885 [Apostasia shenzhenica]|uniref:Uncharacterized protein n=1 Tax=Apostasia shenzhenica TaxID=1088818 RepID=A0A2I0ALE3_9ASPA|nr:hypothetical protein AXF42_Ash014885 [Apostasia shenzhenica]
MEQGAKASGKQWFFKTRVAADGTGSSPREGAGARAERASTVLMCERREGAQAASVARAATNGAGQAERAKERAEQPGSVCL